MTLHSGGAQVSSWLAAAATFIAALVALFGWRFVDWFRQPKLTMSFAESPPCYRFTDLSVGKRGFWIRVRVQNDGRSAAHGCIAKVTRVYDKKGHQSDIDPMQLRWCGVPDALGFEPITLARSQFEFFDVFRIEDGGASELRFETFAGYAPGHATSLQAGPGYRVSMTVTAANADPTELEIEVAYSGDFSTLPQSLSVRVV